MTIRALLARIAIGLCLVAAPAGVLAQAAPGAPAAASAVPAADRTYVLGPADVIEVSVLGRSDFTTRARISEDGTIQLPYIGTVTAANKTTPELAEEITAALEKGGFFSHPILSIQIVSYASRYVTVLGAVAQPGLVPVDRAYRLSEILARVGGIREPEADTVILRSEKGAPRRLSMKALATGDPAQDPYVAPGDKIFVPQPDFFYISGQVKAPGTYPLLSDMTVRMAIARGGGLTDEGSDKKIKVSRAGHPLAHVTLESVVKPGDVIDVGERLF